MNTLLWALQIILAIKLFTVTFNHGLHPDPVKMQRGRDRLGRMARALLILVAALAFLTRPGLILPAMLGFIPWTAALRHFSCSSQPDSTPGVVKNRGSGSA